MVELEGCLLGLCDCGIYYILLQTYNEKLQKVAHNRSVI